MSEDIETAKKRLIFRSWHRGTREIDLMLGGFADAHLPGFNGEQVAAYDRFLKNNDPDIYNWITGQEPAPPDEDAGLMQLMLRFFKTAS